MRERLHFHIIGIANFGRSSWKPAKKNKSFYFKYNIQYLFPPETLNKNAAFNSRECSSELSILL